MGEVHMQAGVFDNPGTFEMQDHVYIKDKINWVHLIDDISKFDECH